MKTTLYKAKKIKRKRKHGFFARMAKKTGREVLSRRRSRARHRLTA